MKELKTNAGAESWWQKAMRWRSPAAEVEGAAKNLGPQIPVRFVEGSKWELPVRRLGAPRQENRRVMVLSNHAGLTAPATEPAKTFVRKIAWVMWRARGVAECLRAA